MGDMSRNFSRREFECRCCNKLIFEYPLLAALQQLRDRLGKPIIVNSGYRCPSHNKAVGGAPNSMHTFGKAADIRVDGMTPKELYARVVEIPAFLHGGIGVYPDKGFVHVDIGPRRSWGYIEGKQVALADALNYQE